jgi:hypothetical protein
MWLVVAAVTLLTAIGLLVLALAVQWRAFARKDGIDGELSAEATMTRVNIWIVLAALLALLVIARYLYYQQIEDVCADGPASACERWAAKSGEG